MPKRPIRQIPTQPPPRSTSQVTAPTASAAWPPAAPMPCAPRCCWWWMRALPTKPACWPTCPPTPSCAWSTSASLASRPSTRPWQGCTASNRYRSSATVRRAAFRWAATRWMPPAWPRTARSCRRGRGTSRQTPISCFMAVTWAKAHRANRSSPSWRRSPGPTLPLLPTPPAQPPREATGCWSATLARLKRGWR